MVEALSLSAGLVWTREVLVQWRRWTRSHWRMTLLLSVLAFVVGWVWNTYIMAVQLDGSQVDPGARTTSTADGRTANGLFWLLLFSLAGGLVAYAWSRGWKNFRADVVALPRQFGEAMTTSRAGAFAMLLWGASVSLVISTVITSAVSAVLGLLLLALAATPIGVILNFAIIRLWRGLCRIVAPKVGARLAVILSPFMVMVGEALGLFLDWAINSWLVGLMLGIACAVVSVMLARAGPLPGAAATLMVASAVVAWQVVTLRWAYADDGGWSECITAAGQPCTDLGLGGISAWLRSPGAEHVMVRGSIGGVFAAAGAALGIGAGASLGVRTAQTSTSGEAPRQSHGGAGRHTRTGQGHRPGHPFERPGVDKSGPPGVYPVERSQQYQPGPAQAEPPERGHLYHSDSADVEPPERGHVYRSSTAGGDQAGQGSWPIRDSDIGHSPAQPPADTHPQRTPSPETFQHGTRPQGGSQPAPSPTPGPDGHPPPPADSGPGDPLKPATSAHGGRQNQLDEIDDILPEQPDREEDKRDGEPRRRPPPPG